jgi:hypothetical protein
MNELMTLKRNVNQNWKKEIYSLPVICNYFRKRNLDTETEKELKNFFSHLNTIKRDEINPQFIRENCPTSHLIDNEIKKIVRDPETKNFVISNEKREKFSAWYVESCIIAAHNKRYAKQSEMRKKAITIQS